ncbi:hypothetical protein FDP41_009581 [Naegleria fowleri]|uniref:Uncharacterized protein n=1 Tax=Naegleria fowleri TaxID=5763 RepID=A0A6A5BCM2_NAEFO|nr:uncharacterized protein FDP41_009581 [Naegleria fowleri]KAF0971885.1 hypothetical protein FDP41_009581 [Naegleria fowleri]
MFNLELQALNASKIIPQSVASMSSIYIDCIMGNPMEMFDVFVTDIETIQNVLINLPRNGKLVEWSEMEFLQEFSIPTRYAVTSIPPNQFSSTLEIEENVYRKRDFSFLNSTSFIPFFNDNLLTLNARFGNLGNISLTERIFLKDFLFKSVSSNLTFYPYISSQNYGIYKTDNFSSLHPLNEMFCLNSMTNEFMTCSDSLDFQLEQFMKL